MIEMLLKMLYFSVAWEIVLNDNGRYDWDDRVSLDKRQERNWFFSSLSLI